jgi:nitrous oxide reductase accessory protein NosL
MKKNSLLCFILTCNLLLLAFKSNVSAEPVDQIEPKERCRVCGMFVIKYQQWLAQIITMDGSISMFDGPKDMFAYYFNPEQFEGKPVQEKDTIYLKDYYTLEWINAKDAFFVIGSDVYGPMGHELIPFSSMEAANNFKKDHKGEKLLTFIEVTPELIHTMRTGQTMKAIKK